jgi:hypothetical protein
MLVVLPLQAQSSKTIREKGIEKITVYEYFIEEGRKEAVVESMEVFNEEGDRIEIQEFNSSGEVKRWEKYSYNEDGKVLEEQYLDEKGKVIRTEKSVYKDGLKVEKLFYNERNKLFKRKVIEYGYRQ